MYAHLVEAGDCRGRCRLHDVRDCDKSGKLAVSSDEERGLSLGCCCICCRHELGDIDTALLHEAGVADQELHARDSAGKAATRNLGEV